MKPIRFKEANKCLKPPANWNEKEFGPCGDLWTYSDGNQTISLWKLSWKEKLQVLFNGTIWLGVAAGHSQPPVWLDSQKTVFKK